MNLSTILVGVGVVLGFACGTKHNPASCCTSPLQCASLGLDEMHACDGLLVCDGTGTCIPPECVTSADCKDPTLPICSGEVCVASCTDDSMCSAATPHCSSTGVCVECTDSGQCPSTSPVCSDNVCTAAPPPCVERLLFFRGVSFGGQLYQIGLDDLIEKPLLDNYSGPNASYSPDGNTVALVRTDTTGTGLQTQLWIVGADGQNPKKLDDQVSLSIFEPTWSPDGTKIAYGVQAFGDPSQAHIWVTDLDGNKTDLTPAAQAQHPLWSPDGTRIVFTSNRTGHFNVFTMSADGSNQRNLTNHSTDDQDASWSPDGNSITFDYRSAVWRMNSDGSGAQMITSPVNGGDGPPRWITNDEIVYVHGESGVPTQLYVTSPQGTNQHSFAPTSGTYGQLSPAPSGDGKFLAWSQSEGGQVRQIWYSPVSPVAAVRITNSTNDSTPLAWQACH